MSGSAAPLGPADRELFERAREAAGRAYAPYSGFSVGAAVHARDGTIITGANVENSSYPLGICAEQAALARAVARGVRPGEVGSIAVTAAPCGGCRQWLVEFGVDRVVFAREDGELAARSVCDLLPESFELD